LYHSTLAAENRYSVVVFVVNSAVNQQNAVGWTATAPSKNMALLYQVTRFDTLRADHCQSAKAAVGRRLRK